MNLEPIGAKRVELVRHGYLLGEKRRAGGKPFLARNDFRREQSAGCHDHLSSDAGLSCAPGRAARLVVSQHPLS
jgi:hypothetical protein